jgi:hypothetical protein
MVSRLIELISIAYIHHLIVKRNQSQVSDSAVVRDNPVLGGHSLSKLISSNKLKLLGC